MSDLAEKMKIFADGAVEVAEKTYQVKLDYTEESLKRMEDIFDSLHKELPKNFIDKFLKRGLTEKQINSAAMMLGAYIGEVIRRSHGGEWVKEDIMGEKDVITLKINESRIFPTGKAYKRIVNGLEDDIWFYYKVFITGLLKTEN